MHVLYEPCSPHPRLHSTPGFESMGEISVFVRVLDLLSVQRESRNSDLLHPEEVPQTQTSKTQVMKLFVYHLPPSTSEESLALDFLKSGICIIKALIHPAAGRNYVWAEITVNETDYETALGMHFRSRIKVKPWKYQNPSSALAGENTFAGVTALINDLEWSIIRLFRIFETWGPINGEMNFSGMVLPSSLLSIQPAWNKGYCWADVVVTATDYGKILGLSNKLIFGRKIKVKPFLSKANRHQEPLGNGKELWFTVHLSSKEWSVLEMFRILQSRKLGP
ncbi:hypothetical protein B0H14DRAFT_2560460 [Mycena olivaceomarginata]|nr:hypothetical protein B0H14DRAFT_2560460 [Mycena olivaceomarginata]